MSGSGPLRELTRSKKVEAALQNESITRGRVETVERQVMNLHARLKDMQEWRARLGERSIWGRLRWLLLGR